MLTSSFRDPFEDNVVESLISEARKNGSKELWLRDRRLTVIPDSVFQLENLRVLHLANNQITQIPANIGKLKNLRKLSLSGNGISELPSEIGQLQNLRELSLTHCLLECIPESIFNLKNLALLLLDSNHISQIDSKIGRLQGLRVFTIIRNGLSELPPEMEQLHYLRCLKLAQNQLNKLPNKMKYLNSLEKLDLSENEFTIFPEILSQLINLRILNLSGNRFQRISLKIENLQNLKELNLGYCGLKEISPSIEKLPKLEVLSLSNNFLENIPIGFRKLTQLKRLDLTSNPLQIPPEILVWNSDPKKILDYYFSSIKSRKFTLDEVKMLIVGQGSNGKTSLVNRITQNTFSPDQFKTEGISISRWKVNYKESVNLLSKDITVNIWDFGGQEIMHATHQFFLTTRSFYLLVLDNRLTTEGNNIEYWLKIVEVFGGASPVLIVGNKSDQHPLDIDRAGLIKKYPQIVGFIETSAATGAGIEELKTAITEQINKLPHVRDLLPETWFNIKKQLEERRENTNFISHDDYVNLCIENDVTDESSQRALIGFLHDLGVVLHFQYDPRLEALGILNPQWVTNGVYKIINSKSLFENRGVLALAMLNDILNIPEYPHDKRLFIVDMMKKFELCYDIEYDKTFLVPDLLPKDELELDFHGIPAFEYHYLVLPSSVMTRFIVRMNQKIIDNLVWRSGVLLGIGDNRAFVKADTEDRIISIAIDGLKHTRRDALSVILYQLDEIHASINGLNPEKFVPVPGGESQKYEFLLKLERDNVKILPVPGKNGKPVLVDIGQLLSGVETDANRRKQAEQVINNYNILNVNGDVSESTLIVGDKNKVK